MQHRGEDFWSEVCRRQFELEELRGCGVVTTQSSAAEEQTGVQLERKLAWLVQQSQEALAVGSGSTATSSRDLRRTLNPIPRP